MSEPQEQLLPEMFGSRVAMPGGGHIDMATEEGEEEPSPEPQAGDGERTLSLFLPDEEAPK